MNQNAASEYAEANRWVDAIERGLWRHRLRIKLWQSWHEE